MGFLQSAGTTVLAFAVLISVIVFIHEPTPPLWRHELVHVAQYERYGLAFLPLYLWYRARHGYFEHPLERDASEDPRLFS